MVGDLVDDVGLLSEAEIAAAMRRLFRAEGWVAEGAGATGIALLDGRHHALPGQRVAIVVSGRNVDLRSEEHTSELQSLMRISYAVFCLKKKNNKRQTC